VCLAAVTIHVFLSFVEVNLSFLEGSCHSKDNKNSFPSHALSEKTTSHALSEKTTSLALSEKTTEAS
jgi:hypothetical protein